LLRYVVSFLFAKRFSQKAAGIISAIALAGLGTSRVDLFGAPCGKAFWKERGYMFGEEFRRYLENDLMLRPPHPDAKPMGAFSIGRRTE